ncbi:hypothetical protein [Bdellovibrio svalbardensis]|uniref:Uncharacterized protein n=1 Tax=Bdellovibrio svalbardensis TaxID=2972972 RepID=A0ABT6DDJ6_9BACT|nr:hypothetical protein [Bdellovibrio svalbardensis]MDG0814887.1 hypothetical protein [Bdellovibrio svalbardensis]
MESESGLLQTVVEATGLPESPVYNELNALITKNGFNPADLNLEELREVMAEYLNLVFLEMAEAEKNSASA